MKKFILALFVSVCAMFVMNQGSASATHVIPAGGTMPAGYYSTFDTCGHTVESPCLVSWISAPGARTSLQVNVNYGQASTDLDLNFYGIISYSTSDVHETINEVVGASANPGGTVSGIVGAQLLLDFDPCGFRTIGCQTQTANRFNYAPFGGFRTSGWYTVTLPYKAQNHFSNRYGCVVSGGDYPFWNLPPCFTTNADFQIFINVINPPTISCAASNMVIGPNIPEPGQDFTMDVSFDVGGGPLIPGTTYTIQANLPGIDPSLPPVSYTTIGGYMAVFAPFGASRTGTGDLPNPGARPQPIRFLNPGVYNGEYHIITSGTVPDDIFCPFQVTVARKPYFKAYGGDVSTGAGFTSGTFCNTDSSAGVIAFNKNSNPYNGSGSQIATYAFAALQEFATGQIRSPAVPDFLSFANTTPGYGGQWANDANNAACAPDYFADHAASDPDPGGVVTTISPSFDGPYYRNGDVILNATPSGVGTDRKVTIYVDGDVHIVGNIPFQGSNSYSQPARVPFFRLIVRGNIFVAPNVTELSGIYVAQPHPANPTTTGRFYSCGSGLLFNWAGNTPAYVPTDAQIRANCDSKLTVYGSVIAEVVKLLRVNGTLRSSSSAERYGTGSPAEVFVNTPEAWINGALNSGEGEFDFVTALPPVL